MKLAAAEARKMHGYAISSQVPKRCSARDSSIARLTFSLGQMRSAAPSVVTGPGAMQLTRMPRWPHSAACDSVSLMTPALEAAYGSIVADPWTPAVEERLMIEPGLFCSMNWRAEALEQKNTPSRLIETTARQALGESLRLGAAMLAPWLLIITSSRPKCLTASATRASHDSALRTSQT